MTNRYQRARTVRPIAKEHPTQLAPITEEAGGLAIDDREDVVEMDKNKWEELADRYDELVDRVNEQYGEPSEQKQQGPPMITPPREPTKEQWERHQLTHTPYEPWCKHCVAARAVRRKHPRQGRKHLIMQDRDGSSEGPVKLSMD